MTRAFVFPGQGSQSVGMGRDLAENFSAAREVFAEVDEALGEKFSVLLFEGPETDMNLTRNTQPALMAVSMAALRVLEKEQGLVLAKAGAFVAGHSLGEYSALCAAGVWGISDAARLLRLRGEAMQRAVPVGVGAMAALLGADMIQAEEIAAEASQGEVCSAANDNAPGQVVISGHKTAIERAIKIASEKGIKRAILLPVSAPFHCALMQPAADEMAAALAEVSFKAPCLPVVANVTAVPVTDPEEIRRLLVEQITGRVRWRESVLFMKSQGVDRIVELGAGQVLAGLVKRIDKEIETVSIGTAEGIRTF